MIVEENMFREHVLLGVVSVREHVLLGVVSVSGDSFGFI